MIDSRSGEEKYNVIPCRLLRIMNSHGSWPVETLYTSLTSVNEIISVDLQDRDVEIDCALTYAGRQREKKSR